MFITRTDHFKNTKALKGDYVEDFFETKEKLMTYLENHLSCKDRNITIIPCAEKPLCE